MRLLLYYFLCVLSDISNSGVNGNLHFCEGEFCTARDPWCKNIVVIAEFFCTRVGGTMGSCLLIILLGVSCSYSLAQDLRLTGIGVDCITLEHGSCVLFSRFVLPSLWLTSCTTSLSPFLTRLLSVCG